MATQWHYFLGPVDDYLTRVNDEADEVWLPSFEAWHRDIGPWSVEKYKNSNFRRLTEDQAKALFPEAFERQAEERAA